MSQITHANLSSQIKRAIGYRILICFILAMSVVLIIAVNDVISSLRLLERNLEKQCSNLESFVISQVIVKNQDSIQPKLDAINQSSNNIKFIWSKEREEKSQNKLDWKPPFSWVYYYPIKFIDGAKLGAFVVTGAILSDQGLLSDLLMKIGLLLLFFTIIFIVLYPLGKRIPQQLFINPISNLLLLLRNGDANLEPEKLQNIPSEIKEIRDKISVLLKDAEKRSHESALGQIATQVAHDIRSPLLVLNLETNDLFSIPEKKRIAIRGAIQRVNDIANNLLSNYRNEKSKLTNSLTFTAEPVAVMLESIVSEKRVQVGNSPIQIELDIASDANDLFVKVDSPGFKRALSNLINNSIEALDDSGLIIVNLRKNIRNVVISVIDNGCGIPENQLPLALEAGVSFGKSQGSGLGLSYVIEKIYSWKGTYTITSEVDKGTTFEIILPQEKPADWFTYEIKIPVGWTVVVFDDDEFIHEAWSQRITDKFTKAHNITLLHFYRPEELISYHKNSPEVNRTIFLMDYEIAGHTCNGLGLVEELKIAKKAILSTNRYEDNNIREFCQNLGVKIIPKLFIMSAHIKVIDKVDLILVDDDELILEIWRERAEFANKKIATFSDIYDFMSFYDLYDKNTAIYIDSSLGANLKGEEFAKVLHDNGYQNLYITSGYNREHFVGVYWVKAIIDKMPPF